MIQFRRLLILASFTVLFSSCIHKNTIKPQYYSQDSVSLFIEMPHNLTVFENITSTVYKILWNHFQRIGFIMGTTHNNDYKLRTKILKLEHVERFVSPDVLPYVFKVKISLDCSLYDKNDKLVESKIFNFF